MNINKQHVKKHFNRAANQYDALAVLQKEIANRIFQRLDYINIEPAAVLDLGCGTGSVLADSLKRYKRANVFGLDIAQNMLLEAKKKGSLFKKPYLCAADAEKLPFKSESFDLIISSLMLQWSTDLPNIMSQLYDCLKPNGMILFTTFGPNTLQELRESWRKVDNNHHVNDFVDMHDVGDSLFTAGFKSPVMDMEMITMTYTSVAQVLNDIKGIGASNANTDRQKGLMSKRALNDLYAAYETFKQPDGLLYPVSWEIVYGHAFKTKTEGVQSDNSVEIKPIFFNKENI